MNNVYSFRTKKQLGKQDTKANDELASKGRYVGCLPNEDAVDMRAQQDKLIVEQQQINELIEDFDWHYSEYMINVCKVLTYLGVDLSTFDTATDKLMIGEDGHVWIIKKEEGEKE